MYMYISIYTYKYIQSTYIKLFLLWMLLIAINQFDSPKYEVYINYV